MLTAQSPPLGNQTHRPKSGRKALQPSNHRTNVPIRSPKLKHEQIEISMTDDLNKENIPQLIYGTPTKIEPFDVSLAEELSAIRQKLERLKLDKEETEKMMRERDRVMETNLNELLRRGEVQKQLEIEVDRLFRLKELRSSCVRISPIRPLRERQQNWKIGEHQSQDMNAEEGNESKDGSPMQIPSLEINTDE